MAPGTLVMSSVAPESVTAAAAPASIATRQYSSPRKATSSSSMVGQFAHTSAGAPFGVAGPHAEPAAYYRPNVQYGTGRPAVRHAAGPTGTGFRTGRSRTAAAAPAGFASIPMVSQGAAPAAATMPTAVPASVGDARPAQFATWGSTVFFSPEALSCPITRVLLYHDGENVPIRSSMNIDVHQLLQNIIRESLTAVCGPIVAKSVDIGALHTEWNFVAPTAVEREPWLPNQFVRDAMVRCGANVLDAGSKAGAVDVKVKERIRSLLMNDGGYYRPDTMVILLSADSDYAVEIRDLRFKKYQVVLVHNGNSSRVVDQQASHVLTNWSDMLRRAALCDEACSKSEESSARGARSLSAEAKVIRRPNSQSPPRSGTSTCSSSPLSLEAEDLPGVLSAMRLVDDKLPTSDVHTAAPVARFAEFVLAPSAPVAATAGPVTNFRQIVETVHNGRWIQRFLFNDMREAVHQVSAGRVVLELRFANRATLQLNPVAGAGFVTDELFIACFTKVRQMLDKTDLQCLAVQLPFVHDRAAFIGDQILRETADAGSVFMYCANEQNTRPVQLRCPMTWTETDVRMFLARHFTRCPIAVFQVVMSEGSAKIILDKNHPTLVSQRRALTSMRPVYFDDGSYVEVVEHAAEDGMRVLLVYPSAQGGAARDVEHKLRAVSQRASQAARLAVM